jgi:hypothetical protein
MPPVEPTPAGYETRDVRPRAVILLGVGLLIVAVSVHLLLWWLFRRLEASAKRSDPPITPLARDASPAETPGLKLNLAYRDFEQADRQRLQSYGWIDKEQGVVHLPIERAMQLLVERGLPEPMEPPSTSEQEQQ